MASAKRAKRAEDSIADLLAPDVQSTPTPAAVMQADRPAPAGAVGRAGLLTEAARAMAAEQADAVVVAAKRAARQEAANVVAASVASSLKQRSSESPSSGAGDNVTSVMDALATLSIARAETATKESAVAAAAARTNAAAAEAVARLALRMGLAVAVDDGGGVASGLGQLHATLREKAAAAAAEARIKAATAEVAAKVSCAATRAKAKEQDRTAADTRQAAMEWLWASEQAEWSSCNGPSKVPPPPTEKRRSVGAALRATAFAACRHKMRRQAAPPLPTPTPTPPPSPPPSRDLFV